MNEVILNSIYYAYILFIYLFFIMWVCVFWSETYPWMDFYKPPHLSYRINYF